MIGPLFFMLLLYCIADLSMCEGDMRWCYEENAPCNGTVIKAIEEQTVSKCKTSCEEDVNCAGLTVYGDFETVKQKRDKKKNADAGEDAEDIPSGVFVCKLFDDCNVTFEELDAQSYKIAGAVMVQ